MLPPIHTICVCGAGTMGSGIAQVMAQGGYRTILFDLSETVLEKARAAIHRNLWVLADKQRITQAEKQRIEGLLLFTTDIHHCMADLIIEAIVEKPEPKAALFKQLAVINPAHTIFTSNTSSLSVSAIASGMPFPERLAGLHFFNPAPLMKLVEIVVTDSTAKEVTDTLVDLVKKLDKTPVICMDAPGFIVNRVARHYYLEALKIAEEGGAGFETIDAVMEATGFKMGPFRLMDLIGNDINYAVTVSLYEACGHPPRFRPSEIQAAKVKAGELGRKTGKGYYIYP